MATALFSPAVRSWFDASFPEATPAQRQGWPAIAEGRHTLILAPTGSGKTLAAFLWGIDRLVSSPAGGEVAGERATGTRIVYVSPLRALAVDVDKNLRAPVAGIRGAAERLGVPFREPTVGLRTGDTPADVRRRMARRPPDILITTPESLYLMLTSQARETLRGVEAVIVDEIHALVPTKRGSHLALTLERLADLCDRPPQRIGLSATQRPLDVVARFLGGVGGDPGDRQPRPVTIVDAGVRKALDLEVVVPVDDMGDLSAVTAGGPRAGGPGTGGLGGGVGTGGPGAGGAGAGGLGAGGAGAGGAGGAGTGDLGAADAGKDAGKDAGGAGAGTGGPRAVDTRAEGAGAGSTGADGSRARSIWPAIHPHLLELVQAHRSTLVFVNARRLAERLATRLNELWHEGENRASEAQGTSPPPEAAELVTAHHGSLSRERRLQIEDDLKSGRLRGLVATSSLELGIDMGAVDLVVQVESPGAVSRGLQRIGRAGHRVGEPSRGRIFPKHRHDLLEAAVVVQRMVDGEIESTRYPRQPLDVLCQHIVAMVALDDWKVDELAAVVRRAAPFADLSDEVLTAVLDLLSGRYPSDDFAGLRPRIVWDRVEGVVRARSGAQRLAVTNPGTIPDRGLFGVFLPDGARVGELDEEMVYESRPGETFLLGATTWRIEEITHDRVVVTPAPGQPGRMPFWHGDGPGRPLELGRALGAFVREVRALPPAEARERLRAAHGLDDRAAANVLAYLDEQAAATGAVPDDRTVVVERFRDELGDWRVCILSPFGARVHAPWGMAIKARLAERWGVDAEMIWSDDGIAVRLPEALDDVGIGLDAISIDPDEAVDIVVAELPRTALFASRFREAAARALLLPRRRPDQRTPLWQQRQRSADLLAVAARHPDFPILLEATRECVDDVFDLPALRDVLAGIRSHQVRVVEVETAHASPFAQSLLFGWIAVYMYEGDAPLAERRAAALALDRDLLDDLLGADELRELLDAGALADLEAEVQALADGHRARDADEAHDLLRRLGPLSPDELVARSEGDAVRVAAWVEELVGEHRAFRAVIAGDERVCAADDAALVRDGVGATVPAGLPEVFTRPADEPLVDLVGRFARTHGPFTVGQLAARYGVAPDRAQGALARLESRGRVVVGEFRPGGVEREWCDVEVLRRLRRRSLARLRHEVEPVDGATLARFLGQWHGLGGRRRGHDALVDALGQLQGAPLPFSALESEILPARLADFRPADLDALCTSGQLVWVGAGAIGGRDGRVRLVFRDQAGLLVPAPPEVGSAAPPEVGSAAPAGAGRGEGGHDGGGSPVPVVPAGDGGGRGHDDEGASPVVPAGDGGGRGHDDEGASPVVPAVSAGGGGGAGDGGASPPDVPAGPVHRALVDRLTHRGASFWPELVQAVQDAGQPYDDATVLAALWDLAWAGVVTNDSLAPVRAFVGGKARTSPPSSRSRSARRRPAVGRLSRLGPPAAAGRWSLVAPLLSPPPSPTESAHARAAQLVERYGVLTREAALGEGVEGGFAGVYPVLRVLEEKGRVRRGYFVAGLGAAQFALPGAVDRVRAARPDGDAAVPQVLAATDPAQPYGAALPWPPSATRPARSAGALVVLVDGEAVAYVERGGRSVWTFPAAADHPSWAEALAARVTAGRVRSHEIHTVDGEPVRTTAWAERLREAGFADGYRGLVVRAR